MGRKKDCFHNERAVCLIHGCPYLDECLLHRERIKENRLLRGVALDTKRYPCCAEAEPVFEEDE